MHLVQLANHREQILFWLFRVTFKIHMKIVSSQPIQDHLNVLNIAFGLSDGLGTGGFG
jgi:hypothetical protein